MAVRSRLGRTVCPAVLEPGPRAAVRPRKVNTWEGGRGLRSRDSGEPPGALTSDDRSPFRGTVTMVDGDWRLGEAERHARGGRLAGGHHVPGPR